MSQNIRNFVIIAHIDHGKSTLADRMLELTGTVEKRKMREQFLDQMDLEREKGITIKMQPVRMLWHSDRRITQNDTQNSADSQTPSGSQTYAEETQKGAENFLYGDLTYKIRGILFEVRKKIGLGHKEQVYHNALEVEFKNAGIHFESKKNIPIVYEGEKIGTYQPDFVIDDKILIELKALPEIGKPQIEQVWSYMKGCDYKLALLVNFGSRDLEIKRVIYDTARSDSSFLRTSASGLRVSAGASDQIENNEYILNLIDTPGHVDFSYEVSRALACVEGAILLVDAGQGVQAQTIANLHLARAQNLVIIPVINKIDLPGISLEAVEDELSALLGCKKEEILMVSGKTGEGVSVLLDSVIARIPSPVEGREVVSGQRSSALSQRVSASAPRALIFDSHFDNFRGVIAHVRVFDGEFRAGDVMRAYATGADPEIMEVGYFAPALVPSGGILAGEIGYIATGLKEPEKIRVGDTVIGGLRDSALSQRVSASQALPGYREPKPMVFASVYPEDSDDYEKLRDALKKIKLNDAALFFEPEASDALGRGFRIGFLGMLHMEIIGERILREYGLDLIFTSPSVSYLVKFQDINRADEYVYSASRLPDAQYIAEIHEPWVKLEVITPQRFLGRVMELLQTIRGVYVSQEYFGHERIVISYEAPLKDILLDFFDGLKSVTEGYGSLGYELIGYRKGAVARLDILIAGVREEAFSQVVPEDRAYAEGKRVVEKLKELLPKQLFSVSLQAAIGGKILARETIPALKKNVTAKLYGGDRTRKMKLWKKQKKGKEKLKAAGTVEIPPDVFLKMLKK